MARWPLSGESGTRWRNDTGKVLYQLIVNWHNSCLQCIQFDHQIAPKWPLPFHRSCMCVALPIDPNGVARPFLDFRRRIGRLSKIQRGRVAGKAILRLVEAKVIRWEDVATADRVRSLDEIVAAKRLSVEAMVRNRVPRAVAERAHAAAQARRMQAKAVSEAKRGEAVARLEARRRAETEAKRKAEGEARQRAEAEAEARREARS